MSTTTSNQTSSRPVGDADHVQLSRLVIEAAWRVDLGRADTLHELFVEDATLTLDDTVLKGWEQIQEWGRSAVEAHTFEGIRHVCGNMRFFATGDDIAEGITVLTVYFDTEHEAPGTSVPWTVGEDHDKFVRTEDGWRLSSRRWVSLFERPAPGPSR
jgi:SnoaL-like domain